MFVLFNKEAQKDHDYLEEHVKQLIDKVGGTVKRLSKWDERQLAYEINGQRDGIFYLCFFEAEGSVIAELRRECELSELVLRLLVLRLDKIPSEEDVRRQSGRRAEKEEEEGSGTPAASSESGDKGDAEKKDEKSDQPAESAPAAESKPNEAAASESSS